MRRGFSLIELIVSLGIVAILLALLIPAVMSSREAARRMHCQSNLKQLGVAIANYESDYGIFPWGSAIKIQLLPYIDQAALLEKIDINHPLSRFAPLNEYVIPLYRCPSESAPASIGVGRANYAPCGGSGVLRDGFNGMFTQEYLPPYPWPSPGAIRASEVVDGLSNTAAMSELMHHDTPPSRHRLRTFWNLPRNYVVTEYDAFLSACETLPIDPSAYGYKGSGRGAPWYDGNMGWGMYNHMLPPNRPSCSNGGHVPTAISTATSLHSQGVNVLFGDGHVIFVSEAVDRTVWKEMGSRVERVMP